MLRRKRKKNKSDLDEAVGDVDESLEDSEGDDGGSGRKRRRKLPLLLALVGGVLAAVKLKKRD